MVEILFDDVLLKTFRFFVNDSSQFWPTLTHVCRRWRQIVLNSPLGLNLRLYCTYRTPVLKTLDYFPPVPLIVNYGGSPKLNPPSPEDEENIMAALKQFDRVVSISLTVSKMLGENLSRISQPFSTLEELFLLSKDDLKLTLPSTFKWGPRLRTLHSTRIAIPTLPQILSPPTSLVDLQLHEIPKLGCFSPDAFANALLGAVHLKTLSLHFLSLPPRRNYLSFPLPSGPRVVLPALTSFKYRGTSKYLDSLVAKIDAPRLKDIDITFSSQPTMDASQLGRFIERTDMQISLLQADIESSAHAISISFTDSSASTPLRLQILCKPLDWQLSSMAQICDQCSPFLFRFNNFGINTTQSSSGRDDIDDEQWLALFRAFGGARSVWVTGELTIDILCALGKADRERANVLPALRHIRVGRPLAIYGPAWDAVQSFTALRCISGRPVKANASSYLCHICRDTYEKMQSLKHHLVHEHAYRIVCSYCDDFESMQVPGYEEPFREHLASTHVDVSPTGGLHMSEFFAKLKPSVLPDESETSSDADANYTYTCTYTDSDHNPEPDSE
jgi:hypothetical protein